MKKIIVSQRLSDFHVCVEGKEGVWAAGKTADEAIGNLIRFHQEHFDVEVKFDVSVKKCSFD
jgi:predicted RNase H-like HicB family nuclease